MMELTVFLALIVTDIFLLIAVLFILAARRDDARRLNEMLGIK